MTRPSVQRALSEALDRRIAALAGAETGDQGTNARALSALSKKRDRLVAAIAEGVVTKHEAAAQLDAIRTEIEALSEERTVTRFSAQRAAALQAERYRIVTLASDFATIAQRLEGPRLRDHLRTWLADAQFDKETRELTLKIRRVPAVAGFLPSYSPGPDGREKVR